MIVVDASIVVQALTGEDELGSRLRDRLATEPALAAPHLIDVEAVSALRAQLRRGEITRPRANAAVADLADLAIRRWDHRMLVARVWELRDAVSAYDACYVALAELLGCPLLTGDAGMAKGVEHAKAAVAVEVLTSI